MMELFLMVAVVFAIAGFTIFIFGYLDAKQELKFLREECVRLLREVTALRVEVAPYRRRAAAEKRTGLIEAQARSARAAKQAAAMEKIRATE
jgi:hypothetical protein